MFCLWCWSSSWKGTKDLIESTSQHCLVEDSNKSLIQQSYHSVTISVWNSSNPVRDYISIDRINSCRKMQYVHLKSYVVMFYITCHQSSKQFLKCWCNDECSILSVWVQLQILTVATCGGVGCLRHRSQSVQSVVVGGGGEIISSRVELLDFDYRWQLVKNYLTCKRCKWCETILPITPYTKYP